MCFKTCNLNSFEPGIIVLDFLQPSYKSQKNKVCMESSWQISLGTVQTKLLNKEAFIISILLPPVITVTRCKVTGIFESF